MSSTLLVPIPDADDVTSPFWPDWEPPRARGAPAHVSVLFPFLRRSALTGDVLAQIAEAAAAVPRFTVRFRRTGRFELRCSSSPSPRDRSPS